MLLLQLLLLIMSLLYKMVLWMVEGRHLRWVVLGIPGIMVERTGWRCMWGVLLLLQNSVV